MSESDPFHVRRRWWILAVLMLVGAALRFAARDRPPVWGDEALTYSRVLGSMREMFDILRFDGFTPLNYEIYYWLHKGMPIGSSWQLAPGLILTPKVMRVVPALCGTLLIPAMYFAARQMAGVGASLLAAAFACFGAYVMAYSHDAKMYVQTWLFVALNIGSFFWWLRERRLTPWLCWVITGLAAIGFHIAASLMIAPQLLLMFTRGWPGWRTCAVAFVGLAVIALGPIGYYGCFNQWSQQTGGILPAASDSTAQGQWDASGLTWVEDRNRNATGMQLVRETASAYLIGTEWPDESRRPFAIDVRVEAAVGYAFVTCSVLVLLGGFPWRGRSPSPCTQGERGGEGTLGPRATFDKTEYPLPNPLPEYREREAGWRVFLWLSLLLLIPVYGFFYCRSVRGFVSPLDWLQVIATSPITWIVAPLALYFSARTMRGRAMKLARFGGAALTVLLVCGALYLFWRFEYARHWAKMRELHGDFVDPATNPDLDWKSLWMPRYVGVVWAPFAIAVAILVMRLPTKWLRWPAIAWLLGVNLVNGVAHMACDTQPPHERIFADLRSSRESAGETRVVFTMLDPAHKGVARWFRASNYGLYGHAGNYYACMTFGYHDLSPAEFRANAAANRYYDIARELLPPEQVRAIAEMSPKTDRVIVWERHERWGDPNDLPSDDEVTRSLGEGWKLANPAEIFHHRSWYEWGEIAWMRRREFVRDGSR